MKRLLLIVLFFSIFISPFLFSGCSKPSVEESEKSAPDALLKVKARSGDGDGTIAPALPIHIWAFDSDNNLAATQTIASADDVISLPLSAGCYSVYALSGADASRYDLPGEDITPGSAIALQTASATHGELATGHDDVELIRGETTQVTLTVMRVVAQLTAELTHIPDDITAVLVTMNPLYTGIQLDGTLTGSNGSVTVSLVRTASGEWSTTAPLFILPGTEQNGVTVTVTLVDADGAMEYTYASDVPMTPNYQLHVIAAYEAIPMLEGTVTGTEWAGSREIVFNFGPATSVQGTPGTPPMFANILDAIPDPAFRAYAQYRMDNEEWHQLYSTLFPKWDSDGNGILSPEEAASVTFICVEEGYNNMKVASLAGIEHFTGLTVLRCRNNSLSSLDVSANTELASLLCASNQLTSLDLSSNTLLQSLNCPHNQLTSLDVSSNVERLSSLTCNHNRISSLDVSRNTRLSRLQCRNNQLTSLDVSGNVVLTDLDCADNSMLETIWVWPGFPTDPRMQFTIGYNISNTQAVFQEKP